MTSLPFLTARSAPAEPATGDVPSRAIDHAGVERAARDLLRALGSDVDDDGLRETPRRVADAFAELLTPQEFRATAFPNDSGHDGLVVARDCQEMPRRMTGRS